MNLRKGPKEKRSLFAQPNKQHKFTSISQIITFTDLKTAVIKLNKLSNLTPRKLANIPWYHHVPDQITKSQRSNE